MKVSVSSLQLDMESTALERSEAAQNTKWKP